MSYNCPKNSRTYRSRFFNPRIMFVLAAFALLAIGVTTAFTPNPTAATSVNAQLTGAIYTSKADGTTVNANIYDAKCDVYLNGGPQNQNGAGLPDGTYYFQVTDPSGATLLSTDPASCRQLTVSNGVIAGAAGPCPHANGTFNPANGSTPVQLCPFDDTPNAGGEYKVWLIAQGPDTTVAGDGIHINFTNDNVKTDNFKVRLRECEDCTPQSAIGGEKYYDLNTDGSLTAGEVGIAGWRIDVTPTGGSTVTTYTDANGIWALVFPQGTTYTACEVIPGSTTYVQTGPLVGATTADGFATANASRCWVGTVGATDTSDLNFGNVCLGAGGGLTLGFWSNKNGQALMNSTDLQHLRDDFCLRNADGSEFNPTTNAQVKSFLLGATATNMSNMLSAQLIAMYLNKVHGFVSGGAFVFAGSNPSGCSVPVNVNGFITISALIADASSELCADVDGKALAGDPERACQEFKKNALDRANNNSNFVQSSPCPFTSPY